MIPTGSKPEFSQKVRSSTAVVASTRTGGISVEGDDLAVELAEAGELDLLRPVVDDRLLRQLDALEQRWIRQVLGELRVRA